MAAGSVDTFHLQDIVYIDRAQLKQQVLEQLHIQRDNKNTHYPLLKSLADKILYKHTNGKVKSLLEENLKYMQECNRSRLQEMIQCMTTSEEWLQDIV